MPDTFTGNYNLTKPEVNASRDTWGGKHNSNMDKIDNQLKLLADQKVQRDPTTGNVAQPINFTAATTFPTNTPGGPDVHPRIANAFVATQPWVDGQIAARVPAGVIVMWAGTVAGIPAGWALCNGLNGTPNLQDRFIVGAGAGYGVGAAGGTTAHTHGGAVAAHSLAVNEMPMHNHGISDPGHGHTSNDPGHAHGVHDPGHAHGVHDPGHAHGYNDQGITWDSILSSGGTGRNVSPVDRARTTGAATTGVGIHASGTGIGIHGAHTGVTVNGAFTGISTTNVGAGWGHSHGLTINHSDHRPPFFALCYIMKL